MEPIRDDETKHPPAYRLDAMAAGDADAQASAHVAACDACARYVASLRDQAAAFRVNADARVLMERVQARAKAEPRAARWPRVVWIAAPIFAAAAALLLVVRSSHPADDGGRGTTTTWGPPRETQFKGGGLVVVAIRERDGVQERLTGAFTVRDGDRVRVEVSSERDGPIAAGLLADDGTWAPLLTPTAFEAGTHYSELAARFDRSPTQATLVAGAPDDVDHARRTRDFASVVAYRVTGEASP